MTERNKPDSPCINVCRLDPVMPLCVGCYRTIEEISGWMTYTDEQRAAVSSVLAGRRARHTIDVVAMPGEMARQSSGQKKHCGKCNAEFACGSGTPEGRCWCESLPRITPPIIASDRCLCPKCLIDAIGKCGSGGKK
jgi:uncharacterized protein